MFEINYRGILYCLLAALLALGVLCIAHASANTTIDTTFFSAEGYNGSFITVETPDGPVNITQFSENMSVLQSRPARYISQGETVYIGDVLDISGVVAPYPELAYWDGYDMYDSPPTYNISLPQQKLGWYRFIVEQEFFSDKMGKWYKYSNKFERQGNNLAFIVVPRPLYNYTLTFSNGTMIDVSELPDFKRVSPMPTPTPEIMPRKHVADYLVTSDDSLNITITALSAVWVFDGHDNSILYATNASSSNQIVVSDTQIQHLEPGEYKIIIQSIGNVTNNFDVIFADKMIKWFDRSAFAVREISTINLVPDEAIKTLQAIFPLTYDTYQIKTLAVQDPEITIGYMSQISIGNAKEYYRDSDRRGNVSLMDVRGYTNVLPGTNLTVTLDEANKNPREVTKLYTYPGKAMGEYLGDMRYYRIYVPLYWDDLKPGMHNLTARTEQGGYTVINFPVNEELAGSYVPPQTIKFMGDRNPWVENMTIPDPIVVVETKVIERVVTVTIAPSDDQINATAQKIVDEQNRDRNEAILASAIGIFVMCFIAWFGWSTWRARK